MKLRDHNRFEYSAIVDRPDFRWPGGRRLAFYIALNVERFSFGSGLGHTPTHLGPAPDTRNFGWREYGLRVGIWNIFDLIDSLDLPMCVLLNGAVAETIPQIPAHIRKRGYEVVGHGYSNSFIQAEMNEAEERAMIAKSTEILEKSCGIRPLGWMGPWISETERTPDLLQEEGYRYIMDWPADDQPFWMRAGGGRLLSVPYPIEINDSPTMLTRRQPATDFETMIEDQFEEMLALSRERSLVFGVSLHTFVVGQPFRLRRLGAALRRILAHPELDKVWVTTPGRIARHAADLPEGIVP